MAVSSPDLRAATDLDEGFEALAKKIEEEGRGGALTVDDLRAYHALVIRAVDRVNWDAKAAGMTAGVTRFSS